jgi:hypothetical protein
MRTPLAGAFDRWIRGAFRDMNTELETQYFAQSQRENTHGIGEAIKATLFDEGMDLVRQLLREGNTDEGFDAGYELLGDLGFFLAACRRHEIAMSERGQPDPLREAHALAMQLGASLGTEPRFSSCHLETHNRAVDGSYKSFTALDDERIFIEFNTRGVFAFMRAADALRRILPLGISHPVARDLLEVARRALEDVVAYNNQLFAALDADRFFYSVRPYYKTHRVGRQDYRGANAGDFAGINVIDLLLGLCRADDPEYSQLLVDKFLFMPPEDQLVLRDCMRRRSLLDAFLEAAEEASGREWYQQNLSAFLAVCEAHGRTAVQHHERLVEHFIVRPAARDALEENADLTASGPPLKVLLKGLKTLADLRAAAPREDIPSRYADLARLRESLSQA